VLEHERANGQEFVIDVVAYLATLDAKDDISATVHYGELAEKVVAAVSSDPVDLIETVAERVAAVVLGFELVSMTQVTIHKPNAPISVPFADVSVTVFRGRA
jgi:dihydroneopterin aldolase/dihydroneopterin aldolase/2-amino-4-hydroxy-6-hydroxymethyldihydropteridine diphosphokinase